MLPPFAALMAHVNATHVPEGVTIEMQIKVQMRRRLLMIGLHRISRACSSPGDAEDSP